MSEMYCMALYDIDEDCVIMTMRKMLSKEAEYSRYFACVFLSVQLCNLYSRV